MPRKFIKRVIPHPTRITESPTLSRLGPRLQDPGIWHINRRSVSGAVALGLFCAFIPVPSQMVLAAIGAILFRVNILISVPVVWISNPITIPPMFYFCYRVGAWMLDWESSNFAFELSFDWLANELQHSWQPFLLGCFVVGAVSAIIGFIGVRALWRYLIWKHIIHRRQRPGKSPKDNDVDNAGNSL